MYMYAPRVLKTLIPLRISPYEMHQNCSDYVGVCLAPRARLDACSEGLKLRRESVL